jgi:hypothetical protein
MNFIINHIDEILVAISAVVTLASAICALTPSTKDDTVISKIRQVMDVLALNVGKAKKA